MAKNKVQPGERVSHKGHTHPANGYWRKRCKEQMIETGKPLTAAGARAMRGAPRRAKESVGVSPIEVMAEGIGRLAQDAAASLALDKGEESAQSEVTEEQREEFYEGIRHASQTRNEAGRFTRARLDALTSLIDSLENASTYITDNAEFLGATITLSIDGVHHVAEFDGDEWTVEVADS